MFILFVVCALYNHVYSGFSMCFSYKFCIRMFINVVVVLKQPEWVKGDLRNLITGVGAIPTLFPFNCYSTMTLIIFFT